MLQQSAAILRLLNDDDPITLGLVKGQLALHGPSYLPDLQTLLSQAQPKAAAHLREVILDIEKNHADHIFAQLCERFGEHGDLENAAWRLAATFNPEEEFTRQRMLLDAWASEVRRRLSKAENELDRVETLVEFLAHEVGLEGNREDYYLLNNSLLPRVIDSRRGIPISLSLVYMLVGKRAGVLLQGVGLPTHFIVRSGAHFFDPFNGGRKMTAADCQHLLDHQGIALRPEHLEPASARQILARMLVNLCNVAKENDPPLASKLAEWNRKLVVGSV